MNRLMIIGKRQFKFQDKKTGEDVTGYMYAALDQENNPLEFSSKTSTYEPVRGIKYDPVKAIDVPLVIKIFNGKIKYQEDVNSHELAD